MDTRRQFLKSATAAGGMALAGSYTASAAGGERVARRLAKQGQGLRIKSLIRRDETILRLGGNGDNFHMSWAADDRQFVSLDDGWGWSPTGKFYNSRLYAIRGGPEEATFEEVPGYPELLGVFNTELLDRYYAFGTLALDGHVYQFLSTFNHRMTGLSGARFIGAKLIYSPDNGRTWCNQSGSTPVVWEDWGGRARENMLFFEEPQEAFSILSVLQMGRNYEYNQDGYVYVYSPNGNTEGTMNELVLFRVPKARVLDRNAYEYFAGFEASGNAKWSTDIYARAVVHTFPSGWVNEPKMLLRDHHPFAWVPSVSYNAPLGLYMMTNWGTGCAPEGKWFGKPSYLGFWIAKDPWGPWTQIYEDTAWLPGHDPASRSYSPQIAPKWISKDGKSFWMVWTDYQSLTPEALDRRSIEIAAMSPNEQRRVKMNGTTIPYYAFNVQRVDLVV